MNRKPLLIPLIALSALLVIAGWSAAQSAPRGAPQLPADLEKQQETLRRMRMVALALEQYKTDISLYPSAASLPGLSLTLEPDYFEAGKLREYSTDGWGRAMRYESWSDGPNPKGDQHYVLASAGRDGKWEQVNIRQYAPRATATLDDDLVISDNRLLRQPPS